MYKFLGPTYLKIDDTGLLTSSTDQLVITAWSYDRPSTKGAVRGRPATAIRPSWPSRGHRAPPGRPTTRMRAGAGRPVTENIHND